MKDGPIFYSYFESPFGRLILTSDGTHLTGLYTGKPKAQAEPNVSWLLNQDAEPFEATRQQLAAYFERRLKTFELPLKLNGTDFQKAVWQQLLLIPYGEIISYGEQARRIGNPKSSRAVGHANGCNPVSIIVPCHRVIGSNNKLTGYAGGLTRKEFLLSLENPSLFNWDEKELSSEKLLSLTRLENHKLLSLSAFLI